MSLVKIFINGLIGNTYKEDGTIDEKGVELADVVLKVEANKEAEILEFWINSEGGSVEVGKKIATYISSLSNAWTVAGEFCASMGTEIHLAVPLERRKKVAGGRYIIHNPWATVSGNSSQLAAAADEIETYESEMLNMYAKATGLDKEALSGLMALETDLTDEQCLGLKFVSVVLPKVDLKAVAFKDKKQNQLNNFDMTTVKNIIAQGFADLKRSLGIKAETEGKAKTVICKTDKGDLSVAMVGDVCAVGDIASLEGKVAEAGDYSCTECDPMDACKCPCTMTVGEAGAITKIVPIEQTEATVEELKSRIIELEAANAKIEADLRQEFTTNLNAEITELKKVLGSNYTPKGEAKTFVATKGTTLIVKKDGEKKSLKELAKEKASAYKGAAKKED